MSHLRHEQRGDMCPEHLVEVDMARIASLSTGGQTPPEPDITQFLRSESMRVWDTGPLKSRNTRPVSGH